jgi:hypothetical protein
MKKSRLFTSGVAALALLGTSACVTDPNTGERKVSRTAIGGIGGALGGYLLGGLIGGKTARIVGAGIGGARRLRRLPDGRADPRAGGSRPPAAAST